MPPPNPPPRPRPNPPPPKPSRPKLERHTRADCEAARKGPIAVWRENAASRAAIADNPRLTHHESDALSTPVKLRRTVAATIARVLRIFVSQLRSRRWGALAVPL